MCVTKAISMLEQINDILQNTVITPYTATVKLLISFLLGAVIGIERQFRRREAGMRTFTLICMGSTAAMLVSIWIPQCYPNFLNGDPGRIAAQVLSGIGFLGAGAIIQSHGSVHGLTTAACIWVMAGNRFGSGSRNVYSGCYCNCHNTFHSGQSGTFGEKNVLEWCQ